MKIKTVRAIIKKGNKYLLVQRAEGDEGGGFWQFVGGNVDNQEPIEALKREVKEEIGLDIISANKFASFKSPHHGQLSVYYLCRAKGQIRLQKSEIQAYKWVTKQDMNSLPLTKGAQIAKEKLR